MHPGGPARSPITRNGHHQRAGRSNSVSSLNNGSNNSSNSGGGWSGTSTPREEYAFSFTLGNSSNGGVSGTGFESGAEDVDFLLAVSSDEKMLRRLNEFDVSETVSTSGKGTDGKWKLESEEAVKMLGMFAGVV